MRVNQNWGFNASVGGVATKKAGGSEAVQLTFPSVYESKYASRGFAPRYIPTTMAPQYNAVEDLPSGNDLQSGYHKIKSQDANRMANAKVKSTLMSQQRALSSAHGYYGMPKPSLSQRRFANPSNGDYGQASTRRDTSEAPFHFAEGMSGGVLRTAVGQEYGRQLIQNRLKQFQDIDAAKSQFLADAPMVETGDLEKKLGEVSAPIGEATKIELNLLLQSVLDALVGGEAGEQLTRFAVQDASRALAIIFRFVPTADDEDVNDLVAKVDDIVRLLDGILDPDATTSDKSALEIALTLQVLFTKLRTYLARMMAGASVSRQETRFNPLTGRQEVVDVLSQEQGQNLSQTERIALSKNLVRSLGFSKLLKYRDESYNTLLTTADRKKLLTAQQSQTFDDLDDDDDDSKFSRRAQTRENDLAREADFQAPDGRRFTRDERQTFGYRSGEYYPSGGRPAAAYFGEERDLAAEEAGLDVGAPDVAPRRAVEGEPRPRRLAAAEELAVRGFFDPDTQAFNVAVPEQVAVELPVAPRRPSRRLRKFQDAQAFRMPTSMEGIPTTREELLALATRINAAGGVEGKPITIYAGSTVDSIRKNFKRRLGL